MPPPRFPSHNGVRADRVAAFRRPGAVPGATRSGRDTAYKNRERAMSIRSKLLWAAITALGALSFGIVALKRGEPVNAMWLVIAALCIYVIAFRFYGLFIANTVLGVNAARQTPAYRHNDSLDYVPTNQYVLYGHHFAAIAGAGPLVGPVLAAQMGYLPGTLWILAGVVFAGAVPDLIVLFLSTRRDARSLGDMIRSEMGPVAGTIAGVGVLLICVIILAVLALVVVNALKSSPWGTFTVSCTIPIALIMGIYGRFVRPDASGKCRSSARRCCSWHCSTARPSQRRPRWPRSSPFRRRRWRCSSSATASWPRCCPSGCCWRRAITCQLSSKSARWHSSRSVS